MDDEKVRFLFGEVPAGMDVDDPDERARFFVEADPSEQRPAWAALQFVIANQVADDTPAEVWQVARDLVARGIDRGEVLEQLTLNLAFFTRRILAEKAPFDEPAYVAAIRRLPIPDPVDAATAVQDAVLACQGIDSDQLVHLVLAGLARDPDDALTEELVEHLLDDLTEDWGPLALLAGDRMVHVSDLTAGIVMTHRLSEGEAKLGIVTATFDMAAFGRIDDLTSPGGTPIDVYEDDDGDLRWAGPEGWLGPFSPGDLLAFRVLSDAGVVSISAVAAGEELEAGPDLVARLRAAYDRAVEEPWLPIDADELVFDLLLGDRATFDAAQPPFADLCEAAGLERRGAEVAHEQSVWDNQDATRRMWRVMERLESREERLAALAALEAATDEAADAVDLRSVLNGLQTPEVLSVVADELLGSDDSKEALESTGRYAQRLLQAAKRPPEIAVARWLACVVAEREQDPVAAERHLHIALNAAPGWDPVVDRAAWYASDRGDARSAAMLWRSLDADDARDLEVVEQFEDTPRRLLARNAPCWCGSGRKYKNCHLNRPDLAPLPDRVGWIWEKAVAFLERRGGAAELALVDYVHGRAVDPDDEDDVIEAIEDPIVVDCALTEGGWFQRFLDERGPLLPEDEALLAAAWTLVKRSVYEIADVRPGAGVTVRDIATGDRLEVRDRTFSEQARRGEFVCARAVPDGEGHQFVGGMFGVPPGRELEILALCEDGGGYELCEAVAALHRPPTLQTREGEPLVACTATLDVPDETEVRAFLDASYKAEDGGWVEMFPIEEDEEILRAQIGIEGRILTVSTHSEARMDRVLDTLRAGVPGLSLVADERVPVRPDNLGAPGRPLSREAIPGPAVAPEVASGLQDAMERRWINESVPALGGLTPREAAEDPTRAEQVARLIDSFPSPSELPVGAFGLRPAHLKQLLGLPAGSP